MKHIVINIPDLGYDLLQQMKAYSHPVDIESGTISVIIETTIKLLRNINLSLEEIIQILDYCLDRTEKEEFISPLQHFKKGCQLKINMRSALTEIL